MCIRLVLALACAAFCACSVKPGSYSSTSVPLPPDYSKSDNWAALPDKKDPADLVPNPSFKDEQPDAKVDIFFLHPTTYYGKKTNWNASIGGAKLNQKTDGTTILHQASIFNASGKIYAPRYRQANLESFYSTDKSSAEAAWELAYNDVKSAFAYYLEHYNQGRPIIIAAHSQGTLHAMRLLKDFFDEKPLQKQLVAAYLVGWAVKKDEFQAIKPCETPDETGCFCSWRSYRYGHQPEGIPLGDEIAVINPLTWNSSEETAGKSINKGTVLRDYYKIFPGIADATVHDGLVWVHKPKFPGSIFFNRTNYHIADYNLFWVSIRENALLRTTAFFGQ